MAEGATVSLRTVLNVAADRDVTIDLTAVSGSAAGNNFTVQYFLANALYLNQLAQISPLLRPH